MLKDDANLLQASWLVGVAGLQLRCHQMLIVVSEAPSLRVTVCGLMAARADCALGESSP
jgi:hypothetical protein